MPKVCVIVPIYKRVLSNYENIAFERCLSTLKKHPIVIISPFSLQHSELGIDLSDITITTFEDKSFSSIQSYNELLLSSTFYQAFSSYDYILIYQLDCFVFTDNLLYWCGLGYDYIGAPWSSSFSPIQYSKPYYVLSRYFPGISQLFHGNFVGNGGLSLRKVRSFIRVLERAGSSVKQWNYNEDQYWAYYGKRYVKSFSIPEVNLARKFAFETKPSEHFKLNNETLPFGCHAWEKNEIGFWRPIFRKYGYVI